MFSFQVESAETGDMYLVRLEEQEMSLRHLKDRLTTFSGYHSKDIILLIGPTPYKALSSAMFTSDCQKNGQRIFLFNRKSFSSESNTSPVGHATLKPFAILPVAPLPAIPVEMIPLHQAVAISSSTVLPLMRVLPDYERLIMTQIVESEAMVSTAVQCVQSIKRSVSQQRVQAHAYEAAVENLQDHYANVKITFDTARDKLVVSLNEQKVLLEQFSSKLQSFEEMELHPAFIQLADEFSVSQLQPRSSSSIGEDGINSHSGSSGSNSSLGNSSSGSSNSVVVTSMHTSPVTETTNTTNSTTTIATNTTNTTNTPSPPIRTLYDCVPVQQETSFLRQAGSVHSKMDVTLRDLSGVFEAVGDGVAQLVECSHDNLSVCDGYGTLFEDCEETLVKMKSLMQNVRSGYDTLVHDIIVHLQHNESSYTIGEQHSSPDDLKLSVLPNVGSENSEISMAGSGSVTFQSSGSSSIVSLVSNLDSESKTQDVNFMKPLRQYCQQLLDKKDEIAMKRTFLMRNLQQQFPKLAEVQKDVQNKLRKEVQLVVQWQKGKNHYMDHLGNVLQLPKAYEALLVEIRRRQKYIEQYDRCVANVIDTWQAKRSEEIKSREQFMKMYGVHLTPIFFDWLPSLKEHPPHTHIHSTLPQFLPNVGDLELAAIESDVLIADTAIPISDERSAQVNISDADKIAILEKQNMELELKVKELMGQQSSGSNISSDVDGTCTGAQDKYKATLLQIANQLKSEEGDEAVIDVTKDVPQLVTKMQQSLLDRIQVLESEKDAKVAKSIAQIPQIPLEIGLPKISFAQFKVGDLALFMPTGAMSPPNTFLAFHNNCPHHYLSKESLQAAKATNNKHPYVLGKIIMLVSHITGMEDISLPANPYQLAPGTAYVVVDVEQYQSSSSSKSRRGASAVVK